MYMFPPLTSFSSLLMGFAVLVPLGVSRLEAQWFVDTLALFAFVLTRTWYYGSLALWHILIHGCER